MPAAHPLAPDARLGDLRRPSPIITEPIGAPSPLEKQTRHRVGDRAVRRQRRAGRDVGVPDARAVDVYAAAELVGASARSASRSASGSTVPPAKLWVFSTEIAVVRTKNGPMSGAYIDRIAPRSIWPSSRDPGARGDPGERAVGAELGPQDVRPRLAEHLLARPDQRGQRRARWPSTRSG